MSAKHLDAAASAARADCGDGAAYAPRFGALYVFGDSLSDNGNAGRFSNGQVWVEHLADRLGLPLRPARLGGTNHAVGGARAGGGGLFDLDAQAAFYFARNRARADALYVVYAGGNDLRAAAEPAGAAAGIVKVVERLAAGGARHFLVPNLGDLGLAPEYRLRADAAAEARVRTLAFNAALAEALDRLERRGGVTLYRLDVFSLGEAAEVGFIDALHPDAIAHAQLGAAAFALLRDDSPSP
jgi:outer membrane lipase/esterase